MIEQNIHVIQSKCLNSMNKSWEKPIDIILIFLCVNISLLLCWNICHGSLITCLTDSSHTFFCIDFVVINENVTIINLDYSVN